MPNLPPKVSATPSSPKNRNAPAILFDLDGTLVDSAYHHVIAWHQALDSIGVQVPGVRIHRNVGMGGRLMLKGIFAERKMRLGERKIAALEKLHRRNFEKRISSIEALPGAVAILNYLSRIRFRWAIATRGDTATTRRLLKNLHIPRGACVVTGDDIERAKPHPDVFLAAADRLGVPLSECTVVGDSIWDTLAAQRGKALGIGVLSGGYAATELTGAGAIRIYQDPQELLEHITELGIGLE